MRSGIHYQLSFAEPANRLIHIEIEINGINSEVLKLQLPVWRPGRYEFGNFAKNLLRVEAFDFQEQKLTCKKSSSHCWLIDTKGTEKLKIRYQYYAAELNAGSSFLDASQMYINPVNCLMYLPERMEEPCSVQLRIPSDWKVATALPSGKQAHVYEAESFDMLADSPLIASAMLQHRSFEQGNHLFHIWFNGVVVPEWDRIISDFKKFTQVQIGMMGPLPVPEYHFLFQILPQPFYHGVEHLSSTVCALGPGYQLFQPDLYNELLGVSSHELFHAWNIKFIRPAEMLPYDLSRENYSTQGWIYEGITTYYGDQLLSRSGIFSADSFLASLNEKLSRHFTSYGRLNQAVSEASFDTWLDGYTPGVPHRKTSIYTEGSLIAFLFDIRIRVNSAGKYSLDDFMRALLHHALTGKGYNRTMVINELVSLGGSEFENLYMNLVEGTPDLEPLLRNAGLHVGLELEITEPFRPFEHQFGFLIQEGSSDLVKLVAPDSPASRAGLSPGDQIIACNGFRNRKQLQGPAWDSLNLHIHVFSGDALREIIMKSTDTRYFQSRRFKPMQGADESQQAAWYQWSGLAFPTK
jgi:predicted metalloprotease with PDZ domain